MKNQKIKLLTLMFIIVSLASLTIVSATYVCPGQNAGTPTSGTRLTALHGSTDSRYSAIGVAFRPNATCYLYNVTFQMKKEGAPTGSIVANLYAATGTVGVNAAPTGDILAIAEVLDVSTLYGSYMDVTFDFWGLYELSSSTDYCIVLKVSDVDSGWTAVSKDVMVGTYPAALPTRNHVIYKYSAWYAYANTTSGLPVFTINGDTEELSSPTPTPTPTLTATPMPTEYVETWEIVGNLIELITPLLVILLPAFLGYKLAGAWGFLAGINVGAILAYVMLGSTIFPLWGIVAILILDALLLFGKVGFRT